MHSFSFFRPWISGVIWWNRLCLTPAREASVTRVLNKDLRGRKSWPGVTKWLWPLCPESAPNMAISASAGPVQLWNGERYLWTPHWVGSLGGRRSGLQNSHCLVTLVRSGGWFAIGFCLQHEWELIAESCSVWRPGNSRPRVRWGMAKLSVGAAAEEMASERPGRPGPICGFCRLKLGLGRIGLPSLLAE